MGMAKSIAMQLSPRPPPPEGNHPRNQVSPCSLPVIRSAATGKTGEDYNVETWDAATKTWSIPTPTTTAADRTLGCPVR